MANRGNPEFIGMFVVGAAALALLAVIVLGSGRLFQKRHEYVMFFRGDVNGLKVGAPVKFKGVEIGLVSRILLNINLGQGGLQQAAQSIRIPVIIALEQGRLISHGATQVNLDDPQVMKELIDNGLRGQLAMESFVTGVLYIDLDIHPNTPADLVLPPGAPYQEIPTVPTPLEQAQSAASRVVAQLDAVDFKKLAASTSETLRAISQFATSPELRNAVISLNRTEQSLNRAALSIQQAAMTLNHQIGPLASSLRANSRAADAALVQARTTLASMQSALGEDSPLIYQTSRTMQDLDDAARSIRQLAQYLQRNPSAPVRGRYYSGVRE